MKCIVLVYLFLQLGAGGYLFQQVGQRIVTHVVLMVPAVVFYIWVCFSNPGFADYEVIKQGRVQGGQLESQLQLSEVPASREDGVVEGAQGVMREIQGRKECKVCKEVQLVRMKHCYDCQLCVATFDHHCVWIDNCVGQKNRAVFYLTVLTNFLQLSNAGYILIAVMRQKGQKQSNQISFLSFLGILATAMGLLITMHSYLMLANLTTWEIISWDKIYYLRGRLFRRGSPFGRGVWRNICEYWEYSCRKQYKIWTLDGEDDDDDSKATIDN